ncbi:unnamed protein product [Spirodela intermedia]|uniref:Protein kinase domain-containing protein n=1 Tax=Spirodela intermedia TaxID=51605 RepID=A0A7I8LC06_SPIIN|nr:unnamed protein product [Spirodela intermedia]
MEERRRRRRHRRRPAAEPSPALALLCVSTFSLLHLLPAPGAAFTPSDNYLLNCGATVAASDVSGDGRTFVPDDASFSASFSLSTSRDISLSDPSPPLSLPTLYLTARAFTSPSSYSFSISGGPAAALFVRLHFRPFFSPSYNLSAAVFNVSASGSPLLAWFRPPPGRATVEEFLFRMDLRKLELVLSPAGGDSPLAFLNAIEVFSAAADVLPGAARLVSAAVGVDTDKTVSKQVLRSLHRVNIGGLRVTPGNDTLWRTWVPDDGGSYLATPANQTRVVFYAGEVNYQDGGPTQEVAPNAVYATAREMSSGTAGKLRNLSWVCKAAEGRRYLLRLHFCDIASSAMYDLYFNVYVNGLLAVRDLDLSSAAAGPMLASPYYADFLVDAGGGGELLVTVGSSDRSLPSLVNAILNGMEVMEVIGPATFTETRKNRRGLLLLSLVLGSLLLGCSLVAALSAALVLRRRKQSKGKQQSPAVASDGDTNPPANLNLRLTIPFTEVLLATGDFDDCNLIGAGGFGKVYKGTLRDGTRVAVKRAVAGAGQGRPEFVTEVQVLSRIRHRHLVSLIGYSAEQSEMILVYEFLEDGSLRDHLYGPGRPPLPWKRRLEVCVGAARGLHYLHTGSAQAIIHRDVKSSNILLAAGGLAKVADFGLCKQAHPLAAAAAPMITGVKGSFGYLDPEYLRTQQLTCKSDVYSFGVVLLEVLCGRPAIAAGLPWEEVNLAEWALRRRREGRLREIVDPAIEGSVDLRSLAKFGDTAAACLAPLGADRPSMAGVLWNLEYVLRLQETFPAAPQEPSDDSAAAYGDLPLPGGGESSGGAAAAEEGDCQALEHTTLRQQDHLQS